MKEDKDYEAEAKELSRKLYEMFRKHSEEESANGRKRDFVLFDAKGASDVSDGPGFEGADDGGFDGYDFEAEFDEDEESEEFPVYRFYLDVGMDRKLAEMFVDRLASAIVSLNAFRPLDEPDGKLSLSELLKNCIKQ